MLVSPACYGIIFALYNNGVNKLKKLKKTEASVHDVTSKKKVDEVSRLTNI